MFQKHVEETGHSQKTIISHPDEVCILLMIHLSLLICRV